MDWMNTSLSPFERAKLLLDDMTTDEKLAQLCSISPFEGNPPTVDEIIDSEVQNGIGTVSTFRLRSIKTLKEAADWQRNVQKKIMEKSPHHIPASFHMEGLCGAMVQSAVSFPAGISRGSTWNPELEEKVGQIVARQEASLRITHMLAPVLDVSRDSRMGRQGESYGEDPFLVGKMGSSFVKGSEETRVKGVKVDNVAKHFTSFHNVIGGIHGADSQTPSRLLREVYAKPFGMAIKNGLKGIMPSYNTIDGLPVSVSKNMLTDLLRNELKFEGLCMSDYGGISNSHTYQHIGESLTDVGQMAIEAGMDVEMPSKTCFNDELRERFDSGKINMSVLDNAVLRMLSSKFEMGLFDHPFALEGEELEKEFFDVDEKVSLESAKQSLILLKNNGVLPISKKTKSIAVIGPHADNARMMFGGYTLMSMAESFFAVRDSLAGAGAGENKSETFSDVSFVPGTNVQSDEGERFDEILHRQKPECKNLLEQLKQSLPNVRIEYSKGYNVAGKDKSLYDDALKISENADVIILTLGGKHGTASISTMGEGVDATNINLPECQDEFIRQVSKLNKPIIGVHFDGRPISSDAADEFLDAIIESYSPAEYGAEAVVGAVLGDFSPSGKLTVSVARNAGQIPVYYNHPNGSCYHQGESIGFSDYVDCSHLPRYCFGYGLSYSEFEYSNLLIDNCRDEKINISIDIKNTGDFDAAEIVQVYVTDEFASMVRPVKQLVAFKRVELRKNETKHIELTFDVDELSFYDENMKRKVERGKFLVGIGSSSEDIRLKGEFNVAEDKKPTLAN